MIDKINQFVIYFFGVIMGVLIGFFVANSEPYGPWEGALAFGIILFCALLANTFFFGKCLDKFSSLIVGIVSLLAIAFASFYTFDLLLTIFITVFIVCIVVAINLSAEE